MIDLKICLIGHFENNPDEGVKNVGINLVDNLSLSETVLSIDIKKFASSIFRIREFDPDVIHFIIGPSSIFSFIITKFSSFFFKKSTIIISAIQPTRILLEELIHFLKPDLILVQTETALKRFSAYSIKTDYLPVGVNTDKFHPVSEENRALLRFKYGFIEDDFIILHVGHITRGRNLSIFKEISHLGKVVVIGSTTTAVENDLRNDLIDHGIRVFTDFIPNIQDFYSIADCYIFPTQSENSCIETPLSVLEAMACNIPIITTKFGSLPRLFSDPPEGFFYFDRSDQLPFIINKIKNEKINIGTRKEVVNYSWNIITDELKNIYSCQLLEKRKNASNKTKIICFIGPDGSGKSTLVHHFVDEAKKRSINVSHLWWLEGEKSLIRSLLRKIHTNKGLPNNNFTTGGGNSFFFKIFYPKIVLMDYFLFGFRNLTMELILKKRDYLVFDRYIYDPILYITEEFNYSYKYEEQLIKLFSNLLPRPNLVFLIEVPAEVSYSRKNDIVSLADAEKMLNAYHRLYTILCKMDIEKIVTINNTDSLETVMKVILNESKISFGD